MIEYERKRHHDQDYDEDEYREDISQLNPEGYAYDTYADQNKSRSNFYPADNDTFKKRGHPNDFFDENYSQLDHPERSFRI